MSSYYTATGQQGLEGVDPLTGLPKKKKAPAGYQESLNIANSFSPNLAASQFGGLGTFGGLGAGPVNPALPDYRALIDNDPLYAQAKLDFGAQGVSDAAQRAALTQRALAQFGEVPVDDGLAGLSPEWLNQDITPEARLLAQQNTDSGLSIVARQNKAFKDQIRQIKNSLASRGLLRSGELGHQLQNAQLGYDQARFDTTQELVNFLSGLQAGYAEKQRLLKQQQATLASAAADRVASQYQAPAGAPAPTYEQAPPPAIDERSNRNDELARVLRGIGGRNFQAA